MDISKPIYLDYNATTPLAQEVIQAMMPYLNEHFGNPSSSHWYGTQTKQAIEKARQSIARLLHCQSEEIIFTSGGSEANNFAIKGYALANRSRGNHIITSQIEHPAVTEVCKYLEKQGFQITYVPVDEQGVVLVDAIEKAIMPQTILISVMHANNEVGTIQPIAEIARIAKKHGIAMHTDAAQSVGKIAVHVDVLGVDLISVAGHKLYAPKGVGALFVKSGIRLEKFMHGASHEGNQRAGTENVLEIAGLGKACEIAEENLTSNMNHARAMRDRLYEGIQEKIKDVRLNGHPKQRLPNTLSISFPGIEANSLLSEIQDRVAASAGAACHAHAVTVSSVLTAMKVPMEYAMGTIRLSTGRMTTAEEIDQAVSCIAMAVERMTPQEKKVTVIGGQKVALTHFTHGLGCACKLRPQLLEQVLSHMQVFHDPNVLVGVETSDDAAVYRIDDKTALVATVDFFTPIVDDPYQFGAIATANSLSDIYAMGARPIFALSVAGFPSHRLPIEVLHQILTGSHDKAKEAGIGIIGGHTVDDTEPKYGLAVLGIIDPNKILRNTGAKPGDAIILTKPIGTGIITTAIKRGLANDAIIAKVTAIMSTLNSAAEVLKDFEVHACTDITGFGLLGHLKSMAKSSGVNVEIIHPLVPILENAREFAVGGVVPGGTISNLEFVSPVMEWETGTPESVKYLFADAQTSGGLMFALPYLQKEPVLTALHKYGASDSVCIGKFTEEGTGKIKVIQS